MSSYSEVKKTISAFVTNCLFMDSRQNVKCCHLILFTVLRTVHIKFGIHFYLRNKEKKKTRQHVRDINFHGDFFFFWGDFRSYFLLSQAICEYVYRKNGLESPERRVINVLMCKVPIIDAFWELHFSLMFAIKHLLLIFR